MEFRPMRRKERALTREQAEAMMSALSPDYEKTALAHCGSDGYVMIELTPEHITGKSNIPM